MIISNAFEAINSISNTKIETLPTENESTFLEITLSKEISKFLKNLSQTEKDLPHIFYPSRYEAKSLMIMLKPCMCANSYISPTMIAKLKRVSLTYLFTLCTGWEECPPRLDDFADRAFKHNRISYEGTEILKIICDKHDKEIGYSLGLYCMANGTTILEETDDRITKFLNVIKKECPQIQAITMLQKAKQDRLCHFQILPSELLDLIARLAWESFKKLSLIQK